MIEINDKGNGMYVISVALQEVHTLDVPDLKETLQNAILDNGITRLVLDLKNVRMITSSGIGIFLNINQSLKKQFRLASVNEEVKKVLELTKVTSVIKVFDSVDAAVADLK